MIMEQVQDWELDIGKVEAESDWDSVQDIIDFYADNKDQFLEHAGN